MMNESNNLQSVEDIFVKSIFRVPDYQRGYSWRKEQLNDFWDDLENLGPENGGLKHYTGVITLQKISGDIVEDIFEKWRVDKSLVNKSKFSTYHVVDGQQRLTTILILIRELVKKLKKSEKFEGMTGSQISERYVKFGDTFLFGYEKDDPSDEFLRAKIFGEDPIPYEGVETLYTENLAAAKRFFELKLKDMKPARMDDLFRKITKYLVFNVYSIEKDLDVCVAFETMNNRGKKLSDLELLKNRLIYLSTLYPQDLNESARRLRNEINEVWKKIYRQLGKNKKNLLSDDAFLKDHWIMYFTYNRERAKAYADFLLGEKFTQKSARKDLSLEDIRRYIQSLEKSVKIWCSLTDPANSTDLDNETKEWMFKLNKFSFGAFKPLAMALISRKEEILDALKIMERFQFVVFTLGRARSNWKNNDFYRLAKEVYWGETSAREAKERIQKHELSYRKYAISEFRTYIDQNSYYRWDGLKYLLHSYEDDLEEESGNAGEKKKIEWEKYDEITKEHIYPQSLPANWEGFSDLPQDQKSSLCQSLGNLTLLSRKKNSFLGFEAFDKKKERYRYGSYNEIEIAENDAWTPEEIKNRGLKILEFLEKRWGLEGLSREDGGLGSEEDRLELLQIEFLLRSGNQN